MDQSQSEERIGFLKPRDKVITRLGGGAMLMTLAATNPNNAPNLEQTLAFTGGAGLALSGLLWLPEVIQRKRQSRNIE
jgi:hypothetical protein